MKDNMVQEIINDHRALHTEFQMDHFITGSNNGTPYALYKQALREFTSRLSSLQHLYIEEQRKQLDLSDVQRLHWWQSRNISRRKQLDILEMGIIVDNVRSSIVETERELIRFYAHCVVLKDILGELTDERRATLDAESYVHSARCRAAAETISTGAVSRGTVEMIISMPVATRLKLWVEIFDHRPALLQSYVNYEPIKLDVLATEFLEKPVDVGRLLAFAKPWNVVITTSTDDDKCPKLSQKRPGLATLRS